MTIREVDLGIEAIYGVAPTAFVFQRVNSFDFKNLAPLEQPRETSGTGIPLQRPRPKGRHGTWTAKVYAYHDMTAYWLALLLGTPTVTGVAGATGAFDHIFKAGGSAIKSAALRWKQVSSAGTIWWQALGCEAKTIKPTISADGMPMFEISGIGKYALVITAPGSPPSDTTAAYVTPGSQDQQVLTKSAVAWTKVKKLGISIDNGIAPDWTIAATRDFSRIKIGDTVVGLDADAFFDALIGSMQEAQNTPTALLGPLVYTITDPTTLIGTPTPVAPATTIAIPKPYVDNDTTDATATDTEEKAKLLAAYDSTSATNITVTLRCELVVGIYTGT